jgi:hypothetical protein
VDPKIRQLINEIRFWQAKYKTLDLKDPQQLKVAEELQAMIARNKHMVKHYFQIQLNQAVSLDERAWKTAHAREGKTIARCLERQWGCYKRDVERLKGATRDEHVQALHENFVQSAKQEIKEQSVPAAGQAPQSGGTSVSGGSGASGVPGAVGSSLFFRSSSEALSIAFGFGTLASFFYGTSKEATGQSIPSDERLKDYYEYLERWLLHVIKLLVNTPSHAKRIQLPRMYEEWIQHPV